MSLGIVKNIYKEKYTVLCSPAFESKQTQMMCSISSRLRSGLTSRGTEVMESDQAVKQCACGRGRLTVTGSRLGLSTAKRAYLASLDLAPLCFVRYHCVHSLHGGSLAINRARRSAVLWRGHRRHLRGRHHSKASGSRPSRPFFPTPFSSLLFCLDVAYDCTLPYLCFVSFFSLPTLYRPVIFTCLE